MVLHRLAKNIMTAHTDCHLIARSGICYTLSGQSVLIANMLDAVEIGRCKDLSNSDKDQFVKTCALSSFSDYLMSNTVF